MSALFIRLHVFLVKHRLPVCIILAAVCIAAGLLSASLEMDEDIMRMLPQQDETVRGYFHGFKKLRHVDALIVDVGIAERNEEVLFRAADRMFELLRQMPELRALSYRLELRDYPGSLRLLQSKLPNLLATQEEYAALADSIRPESIRGRLEWLRRSLTQPQGFVVKDVARIDPIGISTPIMHRLKSVQAGFGDTGIVDGRIVSSNGCHVLITAMPCFSSSDSERSASLVEALLLKARAVDEEFRDSGVHVAIGGGHRIGLDNSQLIRRDAGRAITIAVAAMFLLAFVSYRRRWLALITLIPTAVSATVAGAVMFFVGARISGIAIGCGTILLGITVDYAIHVLYHIDNSSHTERRSIAATVLHIAPPIGFGALTTVAAFLVMLLSPVESHRQVGLFAAVGIATAALVSLLLIPVFVPLSKKSKEPPLLMTRAFERFFSWRSRHVSLLVVVTLCFSILAAIGMARLRFEGDIVKLNGITPEMAVDQDVLWDAWGDAASMTTILVTAPDGEGALQMNDAVAESLSALQEDGVILSYSSISPICPSARRQMVNVARWRQFWTPARKEALLADVERIVPEMGFRLDSITRSLKVLEEDPAILTPDNLRGTILEQLIVQHFHELTDETSVSTMVKLASPDRYDAVVDAVHSVVPDAVLLNRAAFSKHVAGLAKRGLARFAMIVTIVDALILFVLLGSLEMVLVVLLPIAVGLLWTFGMMGLLGVSVNIVNFVFVIFVIGVGIDYSLFLVTGELASFRGRPERLATTTGSITICALTTICGFGVLSLARHPALYSIGVTAFLGMTFSLAATVLLVPFGARVFLRRGTCGGTPCLLHIVGGLWCLVYLVVIHFILLVIARPLAFLIHPRNRSRRAKLLRRVAHPILSGLVRTFPYGKVVCSNIIRGAFATPSVVVSNHESIVDIPLLIRVPCDLRLTVKGRWWTHPLIGAGLSALGHIRTERGDPDGLLRECSLVFKEGSSIHFFPEGTRSSHGAPGRFHKGAFELAIRLNAEIQPIVLCDTWMCLPRRAMWVGNFQMRMRILPRITPATFDYSLGAKALAKHTADTVSRAWFEELERNNTPVILRRKVKRLYRYQGPGVETSVLIRMWRDAGLAELHKMVPRRGLILDLGCGDGVISQWLAQATPERRLLGVDRDADKIRIARCCAVGSKQVVFENHDFREWELPECSAVLLLDVMTEPFAREDDAVVRRVFDALDRGGRLIMRVARAPDRSRTTALTKTCTEKLRSLGFATVDTCVATRDGRAIIVAEK